jgi:ferrous iron transport protein B
MKPKRTACHDEPEKEVRGEVLVGITGTPNSGKTTLFNLLTGKRQHTGNWPGVTVEKKTGTFKLDDLTLEIVDLPGIYGLSPYSLDERIARDFIVETRPDLLLVVIDGTNLERNLYLVLQILSLGVRTIVVLNMMDLAEDSGLGVDAKKLSRILGVPVVPMVAVKGRGLSELKVAIEDSLKKRPEAYRLPVPKEIEEVVGEVETLLDGREDLPKRWLATRLLVQDPYILKKFGDLDEKIKSMRKERISIPLENLELALIQATFDEVKGILKEVLRRGKPKGDPYEKARKIDRILIHRFWGVPIFLLIMALVFQLTFIVANPFVKLIEFLFESLTNMVGTLASVLHLPNFLSSLLTEGLIPGIGAVFTFVPNIFFLFGAIALLEDTGYMSRAAVVADRFMTAIGLPGRAFIPMLLGFGCNVPAIMATRTLEKKEDRLLTIMVIPFMSCSARLPIYVLFASVFFAKYQGFVVFSLYLLGILMAILSVRILRGTLLKGEPGFFVIELPPYRFPSPRNIFFAMWQRGMIFIRRAGSIIAITSLFVWLLGSLPPGVQYASKSSILGWIGEKLAFLLKPAGFPVPEVAVALLTGFLAKEVVISTLGTLFGSQNLQTALLTHFNPVSAYAFLVMTLLYIPCTATVAAIRHEAGSWKWVLLTISYTLFVGYILAVIFYQVGSLLI